MAEPRRPKRLPASHKDADSRGCTEDEQQPQHAHGGQRPKRLAPGVEPASLVRSVELVETGTVAIITGRRGPPPSESAT
ncbi:MAG TPA: hypothetical protein VFN37_02600 [Candidatus Baltobacteraceae bacterium]|nr:hypothetical protein [Candidatus Baltobacteraceae bacterium]